MKKLCMLLACLSVCVLFSARAVTLEDLRHEAQAGWRQRYQVGEKTVEVDITPLVPDVEFLPVLDVIPMPPIPDDMFHQEVPHWKNPGDGRNEPGSLVVGADKATLPGMLKKNYDFPMRVLPLKDTDFARIFAEDSDTSVKEADDFFRQKLAAFYGDKAQLEMHVVRMVDRPRPYNPNAGEFTGDDTPQPDSIGSIQLEYRQLLRGIPIVYPFRSSIWYAAPDNYSSLCFELYPETGLRIKDIALTPLDKITGAVETLLLKNSIQEVTSLELGYVVFWEGEGPGVAAPYWVANGVRVTQWMKGDHRLPLTIMIHPQTGDIMTLEDNPTPWNDIKVPVIAPR